jgi:hypothetical protein
MYVHVRQIRVLYNDLEIKRFVRSPNPIAEGMKICEHGTYSGSLAAFYRNLTT